MSKIVETDNFGVDYPNESFLNLPPIEKDKAKRIVRAINFALNADGHYLRYWKVVEDDYKLDISTSV